MTDFLLMVGGALFAMFVSGIVNYKKSAWVALKDEDFAEACRMAERGNYLVAFQYIQAKLKEQNA